MTDNRTTELRISEPLRGFIRHQSNRAYIDGGQARWLTDIADKIDAKHEQATAATLGAEECELEETESYQSERGIVHVLECSNCGQECEHVNGAYPRCPHCGRKVDE